MTKADLPELDREAFTDQMTAYFQSFGKDFWRLLWPAVAELVTRRHLDPEHLAALAHLPLERTLAIAREALEWEPNGERLVGIGLTSIKTRYRVDIDGRALWTYCAPDTLELPVILDKPVRAYSTCAAIGTPITIHAAPTGIQNLDPPNTVVSFPDPSLRPGLANVRQVSCDQSSYFRDAEAGAGWLGVNPRGRLMPVADAFTVLRTAMLRIKQWSLESAD